MAGPFDASTVKRLREIRAAFEAGLLGETSHEEHPGLLESSKENYLYFFLAPALNYQRRSEQLWRAAAATYRDSATRFVFEPQLVCDTPDDELRAALRKYSLAVRPIRHTDTWRRLCETLTSRYDADPRILLTECQWDVVKVLETLKTNKRMFPVLTGPKMSNYWLFIVSRFTDAKLKNIHEISIIPDTHVRRATAYLGIVGDANGYTADQIADIWRAGLQGSGIAPSQLHGPLWLWSRAGFPDLTGACAEITALDQPTTRQSDRHEIGVV